MLGLRAAYAVNILILVPVALATLLTPMAIDSVFEGRFEASDGLRVLVGCLWTAILLGSIVGFFWPERMAALLALQVVYKALFLMVWVGPAILRGETDTVPVGMSVVFVGIVLVWPFILWRVWQ